MPRYCHDGNGRNPGLIHICCKGSPGRMSANQLPFFDLNGGPDPGLSSFDMNICFQGRDLARNIFQQSVKLRVAHGLRDTFLENLLQWSTMKEGDHQGGVFFCVVIWIPFSWMFSELRRVKSEKRKPVQHPIINKSRTRSGFSSPFKSWIQISFNS